MLEVVGHKRSKYAIENKFSCWKGITLTRNERYKVNYSQSCYLVVYNKSI